MNLGKIRERPYLSVGKKFHVLRSSPNSQCVKVVKTNTGMHLVLLCRSHFQQITLNKIYSLFYGIYFTALYTSNLSLLSPDSLISNILHSSKMHIFKHFYVQYQLEYVQGINLDGNALYLFCYSVLYCTNHIVYLLHYTNLWQLYLLYYTIPILQAMSI